MVLTETDYTAHRVYDLLLTKHFYTDTKWINDLIQSKLEIFNHPKLQHHKKIFNYFIQQDDSLPNILVVGEGNFGKSTLINALLGDNIAKVHFLPTTWTIHRYRYGNQDPIIIYNDGHKETVDPVKATEILNIEEKRKKQNKIYISPLVQIDWFYENELLKNFSLIDTPGLAQLRTFLSEQNIEDYYYKADCVLWLIDKDDITSEATFKSVKQVSRYSKKIIGVITKWDGIYNKESRIKKLNKVTELYSKYMIDIQPVSALQAIQNNKNLSSYNKSFIPDLLKKIDYHFLKNIKRLSNIRKYFEFKQIMKESTKILTNELNSHNVNLDIFHRKTKHVQHEKTRVTNEVILKIKKKHETFIDKKIAFISAITFNTAWDKKIKIEDDFKNFYELLLTETKQEINKYFYETVSNISRKSYINTKYNYDGSVKFTSKYKSTLTNAPLINNNSIKLDIKLHIGKFQKMLEYLIDDYLSDIPFLGKLLQLYNDKKKEDLAQIIKEQIITETNNNWLIVEGLLKNNISKIYTDLQIDIEREFKYYFQTPEILNRKAKDIKQKLITAKTKYDWTKKILKTIVN